MSHERESRALQVLREWRQGLLESGMSEDELPLLADLARVAEVPRVNRTALEHLPASRPASLRRFAPGILATLRSAGAMTAEPAPERAAVPTPVPPPVPAPDPSPEPVERPPGARGAADEPPASADAVGSGRTAPSSRSRSTKSRPLGGPGPGPGPGAAEADGRRTGDESPAESEGRARAPQHRASGRPVEGGQLAGERPASDAAAAAAAPEPTPSGSAPQPPAEPVAFAPLAPENTGQVPTGAMTTALLEDGRLQLRWPDELEEDAACVLYRVVTSDEYMPWAPESGHLVTVTGGTSVVDARPLTSAVRHVQLWVNRGVDEADARRSQPVLLAQESAVAPPAEVVLREDHGTVTGRWSVRPGVLRVDVLRVPVAAAGQRGYLERYRLVTGGPALQGYQDTECPPGAEYEYRLFAVALGHDGSELYSDPVVRRLRVAAPLHPVHTLVAQPRAGDARLVDLAWDAPGQLEVVVYRTEQGPLAGVQLEEVAESALPQAGLPESARLLQPVHTAGGRSELRGVPWPDGWERVHFTPVSLDAGRARVGTTRTLTRTGGIAHVALKQRVRSQVLTFAWPEGASQVAVHVTPPGVPLAEAGGPAVAQLDRHTYVAQGGLRLLLQEHARGCDLHLVPISFFGGRAARGEPTTLPYPGLMRAPYRVGADPGRRGLRRTPPRRWLELATDWDAPTGVTLTLVLVHHPERLPLAPGDGHPVQRFTCPAPGRTFEHVLELDPTPSGGQGFARLFLDAASGLDGVPVALLDPPLRDLRL